MTQLEKLLDTADAHTSDGREGASFEGLMSMAERELGAFMSAVTDSYGAEQAEAAAADWIDEFELMDGLPGATTGKWRLVTIAAAARLARRLNEHGRHANASENGSIKTQVTTEEKKKR